MIIQIFEDANALPVSCVFHMIDLNVPPPPIPNIQIIVMSLLPASSNKNLVN